MAKELPKVGDSIPIEKIHISKMNMRHGEPFPQDEEDEMLIANVRARKKEKERVTELVSLRPEGDGYGVYKGKRRFEAMKLAGYKELIVGADCIVRDVSDEEAADASWIENLEFLRKKVDPITRAKKLSERLAFSTLTLRQLAARDGVGPSTYSEWLKVLELSPKMQNSVSKGSLSFSDALTVAKSFGVEKQDVLADMLESEGLEAFKKELTRVTAGGKRGIPPGIYIVLRAVFDKRYKPDLEVYEKLTNLAEAKEMSVDEYSKWVLSEHVKSIPNSSGN